MTGDFGESANGHGYFGHIVSAGLVSSIPILAELDTTTMQGRIILSLSGGLGALIATFGDRPKNYYDAVSRIAGGVSSCFLFAPWLAKRVGLDGDLNGLLLAFGGIGVLSWYVIGSVSRGLASLRDSGSIWRAFMVALRQQLPSVPAEEKKPEAKDAKDI